MKKNLAAILMMLTAVCVLLTAGCKNGDNYDNSLSVAQKISYEELINEPFKVTMLKSDDGSIVDPTKFDIDVEMENGFLFQEPKVSFEKDTIVIDLQPRGNWCECLMPNEVNMKVISTPKEDAFEDEEFGQRIIPIHVKLEKERSWFSRCLWVLLAGAGLLLLVFFLLRARLKKNRLKKDTMDNPDLYPDESEEKEGKEDKEEEKEEGEGQNQCENCTEEKVLD